VTDSELDSWIEEKIKPNLKIALQNIVAGRTPEITFDVGSMPLGNGQFWTISVFMMTEPSAKLVKSVLTGVGGMLDAFKKAAPAESQPPPAQVPSAPAKSKFQVPGA
jgi:hypothetical protein